MFKSVFIVVSCLLSIGLCDEFLDQNWLEKTSRSVLVNVFAAPIACPKQFSCLDCKTARICKPDGKGGFQQVTTIPCPAAAPYCNQASGTCSRTPDETCGAADATFVCMDDGYFPDPNCTTYHVCNSYAAYKYQCAIKGENFDPSTKKCAAGAQCGTYTCPSAGVKVPHSAHPQFYGYCNAPNAAPAVIDKCKGSYEMNVTSQVCEPVCHEEGVQEDVNDCKKYYKCHLIYVPPPTGVTGDWRPAIVRDHLDCPANTAFDANQFICVDIKNTNCKS
uniref:Secreted Chitin binding peritrophin-like protein n=1 Tax=Pristhesancus plagipennis TaxID=1955184 RepID=A0A2K8JUY1_PRIPG|nr:secreted Chitin binding peritrophin-like protein [Pristhesancus plagipennis]